MAIPIGPQTAQVGRTNAPDPNQPQVALNYPVDFTSANSLVVDLANLGNQQDIFGIAKSLFVDNSNNPNQVQVSVSISGQQFTVAPYTSGYYNLTATDKSTVTLISDGGASSVASIALHNTQQPPVTWTANQTGTPTNINDVQGAMATGDNVASSTGNNPVYIGGIGADGNLHGIKTTNTGQLDVSATVTFPALEGAYTDRSIASLSGVSQQVMAANANRRILIIQNVSTHNQGVNLAGGAAVIGGVGTITLVPGGSITLDSYPPSGAINVIGTAADTLVAFEG